MENGLIVVMCLVGVTITYLGYRKRKRELLMIQGILSLPYLTRTKFGDSQRAHNKKVRRNIKRHREQAQQGLNYMLFGLTIMITGLIMLISPSL